MFAEDRGVIPIRPPLTVPPGGQPAKGLTPCGWLLLAIACLLFSGFYSQRAPCGHWMNAILGDDAWLENDPGAFYVASAHELARGETPLYVGHPGAPLVVLLRGVQSVLYAVGAPEGVSFSRFTAQNLPRVFFLSKLLMTVFHLVSFAALYALARELLRDARAAALATLGYATSFPVLYFLSRISVEPLMVALFAAAFLLVWRAQDRLTAGRAGVAFGYVALAALAAVSGAVTKLVFLGPLPFFLFLYVVASPRDAAWSVRLAAAGVFASVGLAALLVYSQIIDWGAFFHQWSAVAAQPGPDRVRSLRDFLPGFGAGQILVLAELGFWVLATAGWLRFLIDRSSRPGRALWLSAYLGFSLLVFAQRVFRDGSFLPFNYVFIAQAGLSIFFGSFMAGAWRRLPSLSFASGWRGAVAAPASLLLLHGVGVWAVIDARRFDAAAFEENRSALALVAQLGASQRIAIEVAPGSAAQVMNLLPALHGMTFPYFWPDRRSVLGDEFASLFVPVSTGAIPARRSRTPSPALGANLVVVRKSRDSRP